MSPSLVHLPNGQTLTVTPVFGGLYFKANDVDSQQIFPPGWTIVLNSEDADHDEPTETTTDSAHQTEATATKKTHTHRFKIPSLRNDHLFLSSISNPASDNFRPAGSPTRQIAMMLWATLWWYFHQQEPAPQMTTPASANTAEAGKPKGDWRVNINREGIFAGKHLLPKLERMGLIASEDSTVGLDPEDGTTSSHEGWTKMFVSRRTFWQLDPRIYLYQLPSLSGLQFPIISPTPSRPVSPNPSMREEGSHVQSALQSHRPGAPPGPYGSSSHLPTFYPPAPTQYTFSNHIRHPIRPKPPRQGEVFYTRYIPSLEQTLSFRVASLSKRPAHPPQPETATLLTRDANSPARKDLLRVSGAPSAATSTAPSTSETSTTATTTTPGSTADTPTDTLTMTDAQLLHKWMNDPRVAASWGESGPLSHQESFLRTGLGTRHSFPVIGSFDGKPFGYFEIYWVKEDRLGGYIGGAGVDEWDRGLHVLVGEQEFRGPHRIQVWLSALVHCCFLADARTNAVWMEPRVDNVK
jgi:hypothetical protein